MTIKGIVYRIGRKAWLLRKWINRWLCPDLAGETGITIFSQNCIGGVVMSEYNMRFHTPTINLFMSAPDFVSFCENAQACLSAELEDCSAQQNYFYPTALLNGLLLHGVHYSSFRDLQESWNRRRERVNLDNVFIVMTDRDGFTEDLLPRLAKLPCRKLVFSHLPHPEYDFVLHVPGFEDQPFVGDLLDYRGITGKRCYSIFDFKKALREMKRS